MSMHEVIVSKHDYIHVGRPKPVFDPDLVAKYEALVRERVERERPEPIEQAGPVAWYIIMCNPRCELRAQTGLVEKGFAVYLPQYKQERIIKRTGHKRIVDRMLLPRYLFVSAPFGAWPRITSTDGVQALVRDQGITGRPVSVPDAAIGALLKRQGDGEFDTMLTSNGEMVTRRQLDERISAVKPGAKMRITSGPFASFVATVVEAIGYERAKVLVEIFSRATPYEIDIANLQVA